MAHRATKYNAKKQTIDGITFASTKEANRYVYLKMLKDNGLIKCLETQVKFEILPKQIREGRSVERAVHYIADFTYYKDGKYVVEDVKGSKQGQAYQLFALKRKLMLYRYNIEVKEI